MEANPSHSQKPKVAIMICKHSSIANHTTGTVMGPQTSATIRECSRSVPTMDCTASFCLSLEDKLTWIALLPRKKFK